MIIDQLPSIGTVQSTDEIPIERGTTTYKTTVTDVGTTAASVIAATVAPLMDGTAAVGTSTKLARQDHVHPHDSLIVRQNLLDNWYFVGGNTNNTYGKFPVNRRGQNYYPGNGYCVDRWKLPSNITATVNDNYITLTNTSNSVGNAQQFLNEPYEFWVGKKLTGSILFSDNTLAFGTLTVPSGATTSGSTYYDFGTGSSGRATIRVYTINADSFIFGIRTPANTTNNIVAVKLELGDTQTLAHLDGTTWVLNEIPNFSDEEYRCVTSQADEDDTYSNVSINDIINVPALPSKIIHLTASNPSIYLPNNCRAFCILLDANLSWQGLYSLCTGSTGAAYSQKMSSTGQTITTATNKVTFPVEGTRSPFVFVFTTSVNSLNAIIATT